MQYENQSLIGYLNGIIHTHTHTYTHTHIYIYTQVYIEQNNHTLHRGNDKTSKFLL